MWLPRLNLFSDNNPYYKNKDFNKGLGTDLDMPNCTQYAVCRNYEASEADKPYIMFKNRSAGSYPNAKNFFDDWILAKGYDLKEGAMGVCDGNFGHVFYVEEKIDDTHAIISQSQYDSNKSLRNYKYWEKREVELVVGKSPMSGIGALIGYCYPPIRDIRVKRDNTKHQIEITESMVNVRTSPNGDVFCKGLYCPKGIFNVSNVQIVEGYKWFELEPNHFVREGEWLKEYDIADDDYYKNLYWKEVEENKKLKARLDEIARLSEYE
jgi:hypothetical protein